MCRSTLSITERTVGVGIGGDREVGGRGWTKFEKGIVGNIGEVGLHIVGGVAPHCQLCKRLQEFPIPLNIKLTPLHHFL